MKLARRFNAGGFHTMRRVPNGTVEQRRQTAGVVRSRVAGLESHPSLTGLELVRVRTPPLKRRAILSVSLRDAITEKQSSGMVSDLVRALGRDHTRGNEAARICDLPE
jgi:hypothetical protein